MRTDSRHKFTTEDSETFVENGASIEWPDRSRWISYGTSELKREPDTAKPSYFIRDFDKANKDSWVVFAENHRISASEPRFPQPEPLRLSWQEPSFEGFADYFQNIQSWISDASLRKIVPVIHEQQKWQSDYRAHLCAAILQETPGAFGYGHWNPENGVWGYSPEVFVSCHEGRGQVWALAGTSRQEDMSEDEFLRDAKQVHEHQIVVKDIEEQLKNWATVQTGTLQVHRVGKLMHLKTPIEFDWRESSDLTELLNHLHPTPALGVDPRSDENFQKLSEVSMKPRKHFGAPFGLHIDPMNWFFVVSIRNVEHLEGQLYLNSGCGIVSESVLQSEWQELFNKRQQVKDLLSL